jgi:RNA polymerase sigma-70 factor (ECF subfamily)
MGQQIPKFPTIESPVSPTKSEIEQIQQSLAGDLQAFSDLVRPYRPMFTRRPYPSSATRRDADDVHALLKAFTKLSQFRFDSQFRTWVRSIVINESLMCLRASRREKEESLDRTTGMKAHRPLRKPVPHAGAKATPSGDPQSCLSPPSLLRAVIILRDLRLLSISSTARTLGITGTCVKTRLRRARLSCRA